MEGSVGSSDTVLTNQNNSNPQTEPRGMETQTELRTGSEDFSRTEMDISSPDIDNMANSDSAEHMDQDPLPPAETAPIVDDITMEEVTSVTDDPSSSQEHLISGRSDRSDVDNADMQPCVTDGSNKPVSVPESQPASADSDVTQLENDVVSNTSAAAVSSSCSDVARRDSQTGFLPETNTPKKGGTAPPESVNVPPETSPQLYPSLPTAPGHSESSSSASRSPSHASSSPAAVPSCSNIQLDEGATAGKGNGGQGESVYYIKWILFDGNKVPIITQNENGPCPLLAIMNVLLLKGKVRLAPMLEMVTSEQLMAYLGECVIENMPQNLSENARANYEQNMQDAMAVMHKLQTGLDVNVRFTGVADFEYTPECIIFDLLEIGLYHGWLVDPQDDQCVAAVSKCSYNQLVEKIIQQKASDKDGLIREALVAEQFLDRSASQLTYHGLCELSSTVKEHELSIFFRNNHFSTLYRHKNELFVLVTDQGFLTESNVVWETLSNVDGDCHFVDASFCTYTKPEASTEPIANSPYASGDTQIDTDYQVALSLQQDQQLIAEQEAAWGQFHPEMAAAQHGDHELAMRLQEEEDRRAAAALQEQRQQGQGQVGAQGQAGGAGDRRLRERDPRGDDRREKKEGKDCIIL